MATHSRRQFLTATICGGVALTAGCLSDNTEKWETDDTLDVTTAIQYQSPDCSCCDVYAEYLDDHLQASVDVRTVDDLSSHKQEFGIESEIRSCHTVKLEGYVVEGHVPVEVIRELLEERPDITGISLPEMPAGSPGMGGQKNGSWTVYGFDGDRTFEYAEV